MKKIGVFLVAIILIGTWAFWFISPENNKPCEKAANNVGGVVGEDAFVNDGVQVTTIRADGDATVDADGVEMLSEGENREQPEEKLVDEFDAETDRWMDAEKTKPPTMKEVDAFHAKFKALPKDRKEECLQRALNLIPDENVMLLVGILMDKTEDKELVELIYNDVLNRDEDVKKPILQTIFKDKEHPCWADTAWILDVTGELPK